ncbi:anthrone oxygenase family protein [Mycolicibacterium psychrotolerans]|uniref:Membrane protein n=1 Tax=Mycolicibacterium psychrotolerans TaxID=216929 RepID=A0A7I7M747_9MYCO|nr:anthrone oxygenase family protein [Mycolicibacterium psychrotolerans]BBX67994.1 membrane protein [Mycolicibacterium psychrotolerans]
MSPLTALASASALAGAAAGGMMFVFSTFVMQGLDRAGPVGAIGAMRGINAEAQTSAVFLLVYFGAALLAVVVGVLAALQWEAPGSIWLVAGAVLGVAGALVTVAANVPLNDGLDAADASPEVWRAYLHSWVAWNHVRTVTGLGAAVLTMIGVAQR